MIGSFLLAFAAAFTTESASRAQITATRNPPSNKAVFEQRAGSCVSITCGNSPMQPFCSSLTGNPIYLTQLNSATCQTPETEFLYKAIE